MQRRRHRIRGRPPHGRTFVIALSAAIAAMVALYVALLVSDLNARAEGTGFAGLTDQHGRVVSDAAFGDHYKLLFFGYAQCPDVCPTALAKMHAVMNVLGPRSSALTPLFVTLQPQADTPEVLAAYTAAFDERIVGLTGSTRQVDALARSYGAFTPRGAPGDAAAPEHSALTYLLRPDDSKVAQYAPGESPERIAADISSHLRTWSR